MKKCSAIVSTRERSLACGLGARDLHVTIIVDSERTGEPACCGQSGHCACAMLVRGFSKGAGNRGQKADVSDRTNVPESHSGVVAHPICCSLAQNAALRHLSNTIVLLLLILFCSCCRGAPKVSPRCSFCGNETGRVARLSRSAAADALLTNLCLVGYTTRNLARREPFRTFCRGAMGDTTGLMHTKPVSK